MLRKTLIALTLFVSLVAAQSTASSLEEEEFNAFTVEQMEVLCKAYELGKPFDLGHTMAAIAWQESMAGVYLVNMQDPSAGVFHNNLKSVLARHEELQDTNWQRNRIAQKLIDDIEFSGAEALAELEYWRSIHGKYAWFEVWRSYNGGFAYLKPEGGPCKRATQYAIRLNKKVQFLIQNEVFETKKPENKEGP